jgi:hypothetical protein
MIARSRMFHGLCFIALSVVMNGCGGNDSVPSPEGQSGRLVQGPVLNAAIFADNVSGGARFTQDADEVSTTTNDTTGDFTLPSIPGYNYVLVSKGGTDKLTGKAAIQMIAPAGSANVTPLTTLVALDTTGTVKAKLEALMPAGVKFDADISTSASPAVLNLSKSVETTVQVLTDTIIKSSGTATISAAQVSAVQAQAMQSIAATFAGNTVTAATLAAPATLGTTMGTAATAAASSIESKNTNIKISAITATAIATASVNAATTAVLGASAVGSTTAADTTTEIHESTVITTETSAILATAITSAVTTASSTTTVTATPTNYTPPPIQVVTTTTVNITGSTGGSGTF